MSSQNMFQWSDGSEYVSHNQNNHSRVIRMLIKAFRVHVKKV
eukprot:UN08136